VKWRDEECLGRSTGSLARLLPCEDVVDVGRFIVAFWLLGESASQRFVDAARPWHDDERYEVIKLLFGARL
jgi:hypothetical protein